MNHAERSTNRYMHACHKAIQSTLICTHLITFESDEYHSAAATDIEDARSLIEAGFEYVCTHEETMVFRKRK